MSATSVLRRATPARPRLTVRGFLARLVHYDAIRRNRIAMQALDDRLLRDIGLTRADIAAEVRRPVPW
jgi:uncharacterized protein YjiS (DUF1127 family)